MERHRRDDIHRIRAALAALAVGCVLLLTACSSQNQGPSMKELLTRVDQRLDRAVPEMTQCFRRESGAEADQIDGRIVLRFQIGGDGLVEDLTVVESELGSEQADSCVADTIRRIYFAEWEGRRPVRLTKPFSFSAGR